MDEHRAEMLEELYSCHIERGRERTSEVSEVRILFWLKNERMK